MKKFRVIFQPFSRSGLMSEGKTILEPPIELGFEIVTAKETKFFLKIGQSTVELVQPSEIDSPLVKFLGGHQSAMDSSHLFRRARFRDGSEGSSQKRGNHLDQKPRQGAHNTKVVFVHPKSSSGGFIELCKLPEGP